MNKLLIVDDSMTSRAMLMSMIRSIDGYQDTTFVQAIDGIDALEKVETDQFDLVISDIIMPHINGFELMNKINEKSLNLKIGFVSAIGSSEQAKILLQNNALFVLQKPAKKDIFIDTLKNILGQTKV